jgi:hypothetical protein
MDKALVLAERRLWMERDGVAARQEVALQIGIPQWSKGGDNAVCPIGIQGLHDDLPPARGRDFFDVLVKAARTLRKYCAAPPAGMRFFYFEEPPYEREPYEGEPIDLSAFTAEAERLASST